MGAQILDGKAIAADVRARIADQVRGHRRSGARAPGLAVVLVGVDPASQFYVRSKAKTSAELGMRSETHALSPDTGQAELEALIDDLNSDDEVDGILVQLPLPAGLDSTAILDRIDPAKDVDGFHPVNVGRLQQGRPQLVPCTPAALVVHSPTGLGQAWAQRAERWSSTGTTA